MIGPTRVEVLEEQVACPHLKVVEEQVACPHLKVLEEQVAWLYVLLLVCCGNVQYGHQGNDNSMNVFSCIIV